jgi:Icc-related predicted phosphoesterase
MKINQISDLHLECRHLREYLHPGEGDILILAGDILNVVHFKSDGIYKELYTKFLSDCSNNYKRVLYVMGNHEFYGYTLEKCDEKLRNNLPSNIHLLDNETLEIDGIHFIGSTLWTNYFNENPIEMLDASRYMRDCKYIRTRSNYRKITPHDILTIHNESLDYLKVKIQELANERVFIITHHSPTLQTISDEYKNFSCNGSFCNDLDNLIIENPCIKNWAFGHLHTTWDFYIEQCRLTCNPIGYPGAQTNYKLNFSIND